MSRSFRTLLVGSAAGLLLASALGGCTAPVNGAPATSKGSASTSASAPTTPAPTPDWPPPLPANALFQITAVATASNGATARLTQTVFEPVAQSVADTTLLDANCGVDLMGPGGWQAENPNSIFLDSSLVATLQPGSPAFLPDDSELDVGLYGFQAYSGAYLHGQAYCSSGYLIIPGTAREVGFVPADDPALGSVESGVVEGWAKYPNTYGFIGGGNYASAEGDHIGGTTVVSDCYIQLSAAAQKVVATQASWAGKQSSGPIKCGFITE